MSAPAAPARPKAPAAAAPRLKGAACSMTARVDQKALNPTDNRPCDQVARRSSACRFHSAPSERSRAKYDSCVVALKRGSLYQATMPTMAMLKPADANIERHPQC